MRIPHIYTCQPLTSGKTITLEEGPSRHICQVLRLQPNNELSFFNGDGQQYNARLQCCSKQKVAAEIISVTENSAEPPIHFTLALGISKGERVDYALQKAVELGISCFTPLFTERTVVKLKGERLERRLNHWKKVAIAACEQSGRNTIPTIEAAQQFDEWIGHAQHGTRLILHPNATQSLNMLPTPNDSVLLLIGPEGGLSDREIATAEAADFAPIKLGPRVLRTETAPIAALSAMQMLWGDFR
ncbi:16S rRNA (uracil(1498)-N(3))-methyltransferase [Pseudomonadota bacterium]